MEKKLDILFEDEVLVAIHKPAGLLVHRTPIAKDATEFAIQLLRDQIGQMVYPCHRIDRKTSGVLLFAKNDHANRTVQDQFMNRTVKKKYKAIVRGWVKAFDTIDYALKREDGKIQDAVTNYRCLTTSEVDFPSGKHATSRYSFIEAEPVTGRMHQIRKHLAHVRHPIIGDRPHGCNKQNKLFLERFNLMEMMLHSDELTVTHPVSEMSLTISSEVRGEFSRMLTELNLRP